MVLHRLPVLPPELRPIMPVEPGGGGGGPACLLRHLALGWAFSSAVAALLRYFRGIIAVPLPYRYGAAVVLLPYCNGTAAATLLRCSCSSAKVLPTLGNASNHFTAAAAVLALPTHRVTPGQVANHLHVWGASWTQGLDARRKLGAGITRRRMHRCAFRHSGHGWVGGWERQLVWLHAAVIPPDCLSDAYHICSCISICNRL